MNINEEFKKIESIKDVNELIKIYSFEDLHKIYKKTEELNITNDALFNNGLETGCEVNEIRKIWETKNILHKFNILLLKALTAIERDKLLLQTEEITKKLSSVLKAMQ